MIYWLLSSDLLKVEDEHTVLSFIFHYTAALKEKKGLEESILAADLLTKCLRFNFLDYYNIMSAIRKNPAMQQSVVMSDTFRKEVAERLKLKKPGVTRMLTLAHEEAKPEQDLHFCGVARKYFNMQKVEG